MLIDVLVQIIPKKKFETGQKYIPVAKFRVSLCIIYLF